MKCSSRFAAVFAGFCCLAMTSCIDSENPLSEPEKAAPAKELSGVWRERQDEGSRYYHVGLAGEKFPPGMLRMIMVDHRKDGALEANPDTFFLFATALGERHFVNVSALEPEQLREVEKTGWKPDTFKGYWIYEYQIQGNKIRLTRMNDEAKRALIESKKLKGAVNSDGASFKESTEKLAKIIASPDAAKLFQAADREELERVE
jgi:hypothetical protein